MAVDFKKILKKSGSDVEKAMILLKKQINASRDTSYYLFDEDITDIFNSKLSIEDKIKFFYKIHIDIEYIEITRLQFQQFVAKIIDELVKHKYSIDDETLNELYTFLAHVCVRKEECFIREVNGFNVLEGVNHLINIFEHYSVFERPVGDLKNLASKMSKVYLSNLARDILNSSKETNQELLKRYFKNINYCDYNGHSLLFLCQDINLAFEMCTPIIHKLLEAGVNPNLRDKNNDTFLMYMLKKKRVYTSDYTEEGNIQLFLSVIREITECGYDFNSKPTLFNITLEKDILNDSLYSLMRDNGYDSYYDDINLELVRKKDFKSKNCIYYRIIVNKLIEFLESSYFEVDKNFKEQMFAVEDDIAYLIEMILVYYQYDITHIAFYWKNEIIENRFNCVNVIDKDISATEAIDGLKSVVNKMQESFNNSLDDIRNKCLVYKENS